MSFTRINPYIPRGFQDEGDGNYSSRETGDVGEETPGAWEMAAASQACERINADSTLPFRASWQTVDQWTCITVQVSPTSEGA